MTARLFDVVALDDNCTRFACQREIDAGTFETIGNFDDASAAQVECDSLNEFVEEENASLEETLAKAYGVKGGAA